MVSFNCDGCGDVVKKPKLIQHFNKCWAPVTCLDCSLQFNSPEEFKPHNTCISEAEKYQKSVYKGPGKKGKQQNNGQQNQNRSPEKEGFQQQQQQQQNGSSDTTAMQAEVETKVEEVKARGSPVKEKVEQKQEEKDKKKDKKDKKGKKEVEEGEKKRKRDAGEKEEGEGSSKTGENSQAASKSSEKDPEEEARREAKRAKKEKKKAKKAEAKEGEDGDEDEEDEDEDESQVADAAAAADSRFDTSAFDEKDLAGGGSGSSDEGDELGGEQEEEEEEEEGEHDQDDPLAPKEKVLKPLSEKELEAFKKKQSKLGIIYISRIPPGMTPAKVRHILSNFGEVGRIYLQAGGNVKGKRRGSSANYTEGWVEFLSKRVAKAAADMLNAQPIGSLGSSSGKRGSGSGKMGKTNKRWKDDVWTMKYLKGFKWHMLSEQMAAERASHTARLRTELSQSAFEQKDYLKKVERARVKAEKAEKKRKRAEKNGEVAPASKEESGEGDKIRTFKQREPVLKDVRDQREKAEKESKKASST